ncbi:polypeptide N-acetylgalactosaminyltransferase 1-like [Limulus polyphemus]|uniref:Polypeptide N-acetylgalactosaminyltransferase n=1 Tax=Limulus polyphemus TaxID=6850 RepID=A0ABM1B182_LIMPO|nr:polypeptide N-acetylgalactosaminyltransferase 1-like [Limulus polyphemus]
MFAWWFNRRRRLTLFKFLLIASATLGVVFWYSQVYKQGSLKPKSEANTFSISENTNENKKNSGKVEKINPFQPGSLQKPSLERHDDYHQIQGPALELDRKRSDKKKMDDYKEVLPPPLPADIMRRDSKYSDHNGEIRGGLDVKTLDKHIKGRNIYKKGFDVGNNKSEGKLQNVALDYGIIKITPALGEGEKPVILNQKEQALADELFRSAGFNVYISDRISLNRSVPDARHPLCKNIHYDKDLPTASIVIIFIDEAWSALLRTIHSVLNRTPSHLLHEIILVDDASTREHLKEKLENYIKKNLSANRIKLLRMSERRGVIRARLAGAKIATGDVLVFLDSHCEANIMWLEPLLQRIKEDRKVVLCPIMDVIDDKTLHYLGNNKEDFHIGGFTWNGHFTSIEIPEWEEQRRKSVVAPAKTPTMADGLFAVDRNYFWEIGSYDEEMNIGGGENLEMSFRVWMCGGSLEIIPCSHVGHISRRFDPYSFPGKNDAYTINIMRTVEVWMDDYKRYFYMHRPNLRYVNYGDISKRLELQHKLQCKDFGWYLENVYPQKFIVDQNVFAFGTVRNPISNLCLDTKNQKEGKAEALGLYYCKSQKGVTMNQVFALSSNDELRQEENCAEVSHDTSHQKIIMMVKCHGRRQGQEWHHTKGGSIIHGATGKCLSIMGSKVTTYVYLAECGGTHSQIWWFDNYMDINPQL